MLVSRIFGGLTFEMPKAEAFRGWIHGVQTGALRLHTLTSAPHLVTRTAPPIESSRKPGFLVMLQTAGVGEVKQSGRRAVLRAGDFAVLDTAHSYTMQFDGGFTQTVVDIPRGLMHGKVVNVEQATAMKVSGEHGLGKLASTFLVQARAELPSVDRLYQPRIETTLVDLIAGAISEQLGLGPAMSFGRQRKRAAVTAYIDRHYADAFLTSGRIAAANGMATRSLRKLFEASGTTVSRLVWTRRLEHAHGDLIDPLRSHLSITAIAFEAGFKHAAHFSRLFRSRYGLTPKAHRAQRLCTQPA
jgi:AraC-like DNA-binding protein